MFGNKNNITCSRLKLCVIDQWPISRSYKLWSLFNALLLYKLPLTQGALKQVHSEYFRTAVTLYR